MDGGEIVEQIIGLVSWDVAIPAMMILLCAQLASGVVFVRYVAPRLDGRKLSEWLFLAAFATTLPVLFAFIAALIGRRPGDWLMALTAFLMWIGQVPFMIGGLPVLDAAQCEAQRQAERTHELERIEHGQP